MKRFKLMAIVTIAVLIIQMWWPTPKSHLMEGDVVFRGTGWGVASLTLSKWTHCGVLHNENGQWVVIEANQGVEKTPLKEWRKFPYIFKVKRARTRMDEAQLKKISSKAGSYLGRRYDNAYRWSDEKLYCSELVWKAYHSAGVDISKPRTMASFLLFKILPESAKQKIIKRKHLSVEDPMVPPSDLVHSFKLRRVW